MQELGLQTDVVDTDAYARAVAALRSQGVVLPRLAQLADPSTIPAEVDAALADVDPDAPHPLNLFRVHWWMSDDRRTRAELPAHLELPPALTGVDARIVVLLGDRFPMIRAHKVLAAYGCLVPRIVTGRFDPTRQRALWPSTGNYCRGGVAISRILGCRGVAILPEGMSRERFEWLERWVADPDADVVRTPGSESNVKEIYDECRRLEAEPDTVVFNQFAEFGNHLVHRLCTARAAEAVFERLARGENGARLAAWVSASGSAGTLGAGSALKARHGARIAAVEAAECPTLLENGYGEHGIQGIGDKHVPLIHDVMDTDVVVAVSDRATDRLDLLFNEDTGRAYLRERRGLDGALVAALADLGYSGICNVLASIKLAKHFGWGRDDVVLTVATDGAALYASDHARVLAREFPDGLDAIGAAEVFGEHLAGCTTDHLLELGQAERRRIFNLGYYTWVEQQGLSVEAFDARRERAFWDGLLPRLAEWDERIDRFNAETGVRTGS